MHEILVQLEEARDGAYKKIYLNNGAKEPLFGSNGGCTKDREENQDGSTLGGRALRNRDLGCDDVGGDDRRQSTDGCRSGLDHWVDRAYCAMISERCVAPLAAIHPQRFEIAAKWIESPYEQTACAGFMVYGMIYSHIPDDQLDLTQVRSVVETIERRIQNEPTYLQNAMNNALIMIGIYVLPSNT
ncbi:MAG: hypothetical protein U5L46_03290 [Agrobacterium sp.]|nr:hypothetical protein [Agrobacterium sp.]